MSQIVAPVQAKMNVEITGDQFVEIVKLQAAENAADRELLRELITQFGQVGQGYFALQTAREERRTAEARRDTAEHELRLAEINGKAPRRRKKATTPPYMNGTSAYGAE